MRRLKQLLFCLLILGIVGTFFINSSALAQYWQAMPPFNVLWPLWVPELSPPDATGIPRPIVDTVSATTVLPPGVEPAWVWDFTKDYPYFLYNGPGGLYYWNILTGFNPVPSVGIPAPAPSVLTATALDLATVPSYQYLIPSFGTLDFATWALLANLDYAATDSVLAFVGVPYTQLLRPGVLWGTPPWL
jgi:hypothetical protein